MIIKNSIFYIIIFRDIYINNISNENDKTFNNISEYYHFEPHYYQIPVPITSN